MEHIKKNLFILPHPPTVNRASAYLRIRLADNSHRNSHTQEKQPHRAVGGRISKKDRLAATQQTHDK